MSLSRPRTTRLSPLHLFFDRQQQPQAHQKQQQSQQQQQQQADVQDHDVRRSLEFIDLKPLPESAARRRRIEQDLENQAKFEVFGDSLWDLRSEIEDLSQQLLNAIHGGATEATDEARTRQKLKEAERRDPELAYKLALAEVKLAEREGRTDDAKQHQETANAARSCLPQFNLEGLWVGKYGSSYDLINITYVGDLLIAEKVTGDHNVPRGALTFQADLSPLRKSAPNGALQPISLTEKAARKWGTKKLPRYSGLGQVAEENFRNNQWVDGQLIIIGTEYFSFAWLPIEMQIFFGRRDPGTGGF
jgi:hypothetical protein